MDSKLFGARTVFLLGVYTVLRTMKPWTINRGLGTTIQIINGGYLPGTGGSVFYTGAHTHTMCLRWGTLASRVHWTVAAPWSSPMLTIKAVRGGAD